MATKVKKGNTWAYTVKRKALLPKPIYLTFDSEAEGDAYILNLEKLLDAGVVPESFKNAPSPRHSLKHAIDAYLDKVHVPDNDSALLQIDRARVGDRRMDSLDYAWAEQWVAGMRETLTPSTIRHHVGALARCLDWVVRTGATELLSNPLRMLPKRYATSAENKDVERDRRLQPGEEKAIRDVLKGKKPEGRQRMLELKHRDALLMLFDLALETAMRMREMYTISADQVDIAKRTVFLDDTKNGDRRQVPLSTLAVAMLTPIAGGCGLVFPWWDGRPESLRKTTALLSQQFARVFNAAGCPDLRFHDLRHEATSRFYERTNLSDLQIAKIVGHKDTKMLMRYSNLRGSDLAAKLW